MRRKQTGPLVAPGLSPIDTCAAAPATANSVVRFGRFSVVPGARLLFRDGRTVKIGGRAFDLLMVLLRSPGVVVSKAEILRYVWPSLIVDDTNLRFQMSCLRKAFGGERDIVRTIPGRGYLLVADLPDTPKPRPSDRPFESTPACPAAVEAESAASMETATVFVVEDDLDTREALEGLLRSVGWRVESFPSVQAFLEGPRPSSPGCLVLDVWLPGRSGLDLQAELTRQGIHLPVIFISGHADIPMSVRAMKAGAIEFLTKPVRHQELLEAVRLGTERSMQTFS